MSAKPAISVKGVRFGYTTSRSDACDENCAGDVLCGVSLDVEAGTCMCLMGANGCGKSTLLDCILGTNKPRAGEILIQGEPAESFSPAQLALKLSYVPQVHERSFPYLVEQVVEMGRTAHLGMFGAIGEDDVFAAQNAMDLCGIRHLAKRPYTKLSGGEMQMVMLARALAQGASIVIMDEPTAHLDFRNEVLFLETVERLVRDSGMTVLMATHAPNQAFHLERAGISVFVALMDGGRIVCADSPQNALTEDALRDVFGVSAVLLDGRPNGALDDEMRSIRQIAPIRTVDKHIKGTFDDA